MFCWEVGHVWTGRNKLCNVMCRAHKICFSCIPFNKVTLVHQTYLHNLCPIGSNYLESISWLIFPACYQIVKLMFLRAICNPRELFSPALPFWLKTSTDNIQMNEPWPVHTWKKKNRWSDLASVSGASERLRWLKTLGSSLMTSLIPGTHIVEKGKQLPSRFHFDHIQTHIDNKSNKNVNET